MAEKTDNFQALMEREKPTILKMLPSYVTPDRWWALAMEVQKNPRLMNCTPVSLVNSVVNIAKWGLEIGEHVYIIPYGNEAQAQPSYKGLIYRAIEAEVCVDVYADVVYDKDDFYVISGSRRELVHKPKHFAGDRGKIKGAYACATLANGIVVFEVLELSDIEAIKGAALRMNERGGGKGLSPAWKFFEGEMIKKSAMRRLLKRLQGKRSGENADRLAAVLATQYREEPADIEVDVIDAPVAAITPAPASGGAEDAAKPSARPAPASTAKTPEVVSQPKQKERKRIASDEIGDLRDQVDGYDLPMSTILTTLQQFGANDYKDLYQDQVSDFAKAIAAAKEQAA